MLTVDYDRLDVRPGQRVLDVGCGGGRHSYEALRRGAQVVALDTDGDELAGVGVMLDAMSSEGEAPPGATGATVLADGRRLPFADASFDRVIAAEVLEHVTDDAVVLDEIRRVLRPGGRAAVTVPRCWPELVCWGLSRDYHESDGGHVRIYRRRQLVRRLAAAGLAVRGSHHAHGLHSPYWWLRCAVGIERDPWPVRAYHRLLVWDIVHAPPVTRAMERVLDPVLGKSLVLYVEHARPPASGRGHERDGRAGRSHAPQEVLGWEVLGTVAS